MKDGWFKSGQIQKLSSHKVSGSDKFIIMIRKILFNALTDYLIMELNLFKASLFEKDLIGFIWRLVELTLFWILFFVLGNYTTVLL